MKVVFPDPDLASGEPDRITGIRRRKWKKGSDQVILRP